MNDILVIFIPWSRSKHGARALLQPAARKVFTFGGIRVDCQQVAGDALGMELNGLVLESHADTCLFVYGDAVLSRELIAMHVSAHAQAASERVIGVTPGQGGLSPRSAHCAPVSLPRSLVLEAAGFRHDLSYAAVSVLVSRVMTTDTSAQLVPIGDSTMVATDSGLARTRFIGAADIELFGCHPEVLPHTALGGFNEGAVRAVLLRRFLLKLPVDGRGYALLWRLILGDGAIRNYAAFMHDLLYWRGVRDAIAEEHAWKSLTHGVTILMYHACTIGNEPASHYVVSRRRFKSHMLWLRLARIQVLPLDAYADMRRRHVLPPARSVVITFDDGYADTFEVALPVLMRLKLHATSFVVSSLINSVCTWVEDGPLAGRTMLTWPMARAMQHEGVRVGAHTHTHRSLTTISTAEMHEEMDRARCEIQTHLQTPVVTMSYPDGQHNSATEMAARRCGYLCACTSVPGPNDADTPLFALRRTEIRGTDSLLSFILATYFGRTEILAHLRHGW